MSEHKALIPVFVPFEAWRVYLPPEYKDIPLTAWLQKSRRNDWAAYLKPLGERSVPVWRASDVLAWFRLSFGVSHPHVVQAMLDAGYVDAEPLQTFKQPNKKRRRR